MAISIFESDSLDIAITVTRSGNGSALDLSGATFTARAGLDDFIIDGVVTVQDAAGGQVFVSFPAGSFQGQAGGHEFQLHVGMGGEEQTVASTAFIVSRPIQGDAAPAPLVNLACGMKCAC